MTNLQIAKDAYATAKKLGASSKVLLALFETGIVESGFKNYANRNVPASLKLPHDAVGSDHHSVGYLQQQSPGWGTVAQCMNTAHATTMFVNKAKKYEHSVSTSGRLAQRVQGSAFPSRYDQVSSAARSLLARVASIKVVPSPAPSSHPYPGTPLKVGSTGAHVREWQQKMHDRGKTITVDGSYGAKSEAVCKAFQKEKRLVQDGHVGPATWAATFAKTLSLPTSASESLEYLSEEELLAPIPGPSDLGLTDDEFDSILSNEVEAAFLEAESTKVPEDSVIDAPEDNDTTVYPEQG